MIDPNATNDFNIASAATLSIVGNYVQQSTGDYHVDLRSAGTDLLAITGNATLAGDLFIFGSRSLYETVEVLTTTGSVSGIFDTVSSDPIDTIESDGEAQAVTYHSDSVNVTRAFQGDANLDGTVNVLGDAFVLVGNLGTTGGATWAEGDFTGDGVVNVLGDAFALVGNLGRTFSP